MFPLVVLLQCGAASSPRQALGASSTTITVTAQAIGRVPADYVGFNIETAAACRLLELEGVHPQIDTLFRNLAPAVLRIGGNSSDHITWDPSAGCAGSAFTIGTSALDGIFALAPAKTTCR